jgi:hypothetical protein
LLSAIAPGACIDAPVEPDPPFARLVAVWDPLACGDPHRVVVELYDDDGAGAAASAPCNIGGLTVDVAHFGSYRGRIYAWALGAAIRSEAAIEVTIDRPIVQWTVETPRWSAVARAIAAAGRSSRRSRRPGDRRRWAPGGARPRRG